MRYAFWALLLAACSSDAGPLPSSNLPPPAAVGVLGSGTAALAGSKAGQAGSTASPGSDAGVPPDADLPEADASEPAQSADSGPVADLPDAASPTPAVLPPELFVGVWRLTRHAFPCDDAPDWAAPAETSGTLAVSAAYDLMLHWAGLPDPAPFAGTLDGALLTGLYQADITTPLGGPTTYGKPRLALTGPNTLQGVETTWGVWSPGADTCYAVSGEKP